MLIAVPFPENRVRCYGTAPVQRRRTDLFDVRDAAIRDTVLDQVFSNPAVREIRADVERQVKVGELTPALAAQQISKAASI